MPDIEVGGKALISQSGTADPVIQSNVNFTGAIDSTATGTFSGTTTGTISSSTTFPPGHIIQTFGNYSNVGFSFDPDANWVEFGGTDATQNLRVTITPTSTSNKLLMRCTIVSNPTSVSQIWSWRFYDITGSSVVEPKGAVVGSRNQQHFASRPVAYDANDPETLSYELWADIARTTETVYTIHGRNADGGGVMVVNRSNGDNSSWGWTGVSSFIIQEIQQ